MTGCTFTLPSQPGRKTTVVPAWSPDQADLSLFPLGLLTKRSAHLAGSGQETRPERERQDACVPAWSPDQAELPAGRPPAGGLVRRPGRNGSDKTRAFPLGLPTKRSSQQGARRPGPGQETRPERGRPLDVVVVIVVGIGFLPLGLPTKQNLPQGIHRLRPGQEIRPERGAWSGDQAGTGSEYDKERDKEKELCPNRCSRLVSRPSRTLGDPSRGGLARRPGRNGRNRPRQRLRQRYRCRGPGQETRPERERCCFVRIPG